MAAIPAPVDAPEVRRAPAHPPRAAPRALPPDQPAPYLTRPALDTWLAGGLSLVVLAVVALLSPLAGIGAEHRKPAPQPRVDRAHPLVVRQLSPLPRVVSPRVLATRIGRASHVHAVVRADRPRGRGHRRVRHLQLEHHRCSARRSMRFGSRLAGWIIELMFLTVGWHYVKQAYGCARVGARLRKYPMRSDRRPRAPVRALSALGCGVGTSQRVDRTASTSRASRTARCACRTGSSPLSNIAIGVGAIAVCAVLVGMYRSNRRRPAVADGRSTDRDVRLVDSRHVQPDVLGARADVPLAAVLAVRVQGRTGSHRRACARGVACAPAPHRHRDRSGGRGVGRVRDRARHRRSSHARAARRPASCSSPR